jgi:hypothetical protein
LGKVSICGIVAMMIIQTEKNRIATMAAEAEANHLTQNCRLKIKYKAIMPTANSINRYKLIGNLNMPIGMLPKNS